MTNTGQRILIRIADVCNNTIWDHHNETWFEMRLFDYFEGFALIPPRPYELYDDKYSLIEIADQLAGLCAARNKDNG